MPDQKKKKKSLIKQCELTIFYHAFKSDKNMERMQQSKENRVF